jgi:hypothetical protein
MKESCIIAAEGTPIKLYRSDLGGPEGVDGVLGILCPCLHNFLGKQPFHGGRFLAELLTTFAVSESTYKLRRANLAKAPSGKQILTAVYLKVNDVYYSLHTRFRPGVRYFYLLRNNGSVEVYDGDILKRLQFSEDLFHYNQANAIQVVVPEQDIKPKKFEQFN